MNQTEYMLNLIKNSVYATGADFSHHKGEWDLSTVDMALFDEVMDFAILRAGYGAEDGTIHEDRKFEDNYAILETVPKIRRGAYWYFSSHSSPQAQFNFFVQLLEDKEFEFIVLDVEQYYNVASKVFADSAVWFLEQLEQKFPDKRVLVYGNRYDYVDLIWKYNKTIDRFNYWIAQYPWRNWVQYFTEYFKVWWNDLFGTFQKQPKLPVHLPPNAWEIWQVVASSGIGNELGFESDELDYNITRRTKDEFFKWLGLPKRLTEQPPEPPPTDPDNPPSGIYLPNDKAAELRAHLELVGAHNDDALACLAEGIPIYQGTEPPPDEEPPTEPPVEPPVEPEPDYFKTYNYAYKGGEKANFYRGKINETSGRTKLDRTNKQVAYNNTVKYLGYPQKIEADWYIKLTQAGIDEGAKSDHIMARNLENVKPFEEYKDIRFVEFEGVRGFIFANVAQPYKNGYGENL